MSTRKIAGTALITAGLAAGVLAFQSWQTRDDLALAEEGRNVLARAERLHGHGVRPETASRDRAMPSELLSAAASIPEPSAATIAVAEGEGGFRMPTADEMARARDAIAAELELLSPGPVEQIPTTSGVGYTLGMRGASVALYWPQPGGGEAGETMAVTCHDAPGLHLDADREGL